MTVHNMIGLQTTVRQSATLEPSGDGSHRYAVKSQYWELSKWFQESKSWVDCGPFPTDRKIEGESNNGRGNERKRRTRPVTQAIAFVIII